MAAHGKARQREAADLQPLRKVVAPHRHCRAIGMDDLAAAGIDQHVAGHVEQIAAPELALAAYRNRLADRVALHVGIAQYSDADVAERVLHQPRAIDAEKALAAPQI